MNSRRALAASMAAIIFGTSYGVASASVIDIGSNTGFANTFPFGGAYGGEYQQVYNGALFPGAVDITGIRFFNTQHPSETITGNFVLSLSTTSAGVSSLSTTYANNIGSNNAVFFSGAVINTLSFNGGPFLFDPSQGNLLLDVFAISTSANSVGLDAGCSVNLNRVYNSGGIGAPQIGNASCTLPQGHGLQTEFTFTAVAAAVPEPGSFGLFGAGLLSLIGFCSLRRRQARSIV